MTFSKQIVSFAAKTRLDADRVLRVTALHAFGALQKRSPVDTGRFRGSWRLSVNRVDLSVNAQSRTPQSGFRKSKYGPRWGDPTLFPGEATALGARFGDTINITNNVEYAPYLEAGRSRVQAPQGVLRPTFAQLVRDFPRIVASVRRT